MAKIFITGIGTEIGKTIVSAILAAHSNYYYWKPIQSGAHEGMDAQQIKNISPYTQIIPSTYTLQAFLSPDQAAKLENCEIDINKLIPPKYNNVLIEGAGGIYTPLNTHTRIIDIIPKIADGCIVVTHSGLGTITPTLLTIEALQQRNIKIYGIVMCGALHRMNRQSIQNFTSVKIIGSIPILKDLSPDYIKYNTKKYFTKELRHELEF